MSDRLKMIEQLLAKGSADPLHWYMRAMELRSIGRHDDALVAFAAVRERFGEYVPTYLMAAQLAQELDRTDEARAWADQGIERARHKGDDHALRELAALRDMIG